MKRMKRLTIVYILVAIAQISLFYYLFLGGNHSLKTADLIQMIVIGIFIIGCYTTIVIIIQKIVKNRQKQDEEEKRLLKEKYEEDYYNLTKEQAKKIDEIKQEMTVSLAQIEEILQEGNENIENRARLEKRLNEAENKVNQFGMVYYCSDSVLNALLAVKQEKAASLGIDMDIMVRNTGNTDVTDMDMCSIVTNLLDNAIEAVQNKKEKEREKESAEQEGKDRRAESAKQKGKEQQAEDVKQEGKEQRAESVKQVEKEDELLDDIIVRIGRQANYFVIRVKNRMEEEPKVNKKGKFISSKKEESSEKLHGRGFRIVETLVEKYGGYVDVHIEEKDWMIVTVFLEEKEEE